MFDRNPKQASRLRKPAAKVFAFVLFSRSNLPDEKISFVWPRHGPYDGVNQGRQAVVVLVLLLVVVDSGGPSIVAVAAGHDQHIFRL